MVASRRGPGTVTALVVQGGGMRGIYSAAAMGALQELGLSQAFDHIFGASSGAINGAYLMAGQADIAAAGYADHLNRASPFIRYGRIGKIVDIDYLVDRILKHEKVPLDVRAVVESRSVLHTVVTDYETAEPAVITSKEIGARDASGQLLYEVFRATAAMPVLYNRPVEVNGRFYVDGGIVDAIPLQRALDAGCTDILVVMTRNPAFRRHRPAWWLRAVGRVALAKHPQPLRARLLREDALFNRTLALIQNPGALEGRARLVVVSPSDEGRLASRTTRDRDKLWDCAAMARADVLRIVGPGSA